MLIQFEKGKLYIACQLCFYQLINMSGLDRMEWKVQYNKAIGLLRAGVGFDFYVNEWSVSRIARAYGISRARVSNIIIEYDKLFRSKKQK